LKKGARNMSGIIPALPWRDRRKLRRTSIKIVVPFEIQSEYLPNTNNIFFRLLKLACSDGSETEKAAIGWHVARCDEQGMYGVLSRSLLKWVI
jgi:hypothetical protein